MPSLRLSSRTLADFQICPQRYALAVQAHVPRPVLEPSPSLSVGNALHAALRDLYAPGGAVPAAAERAAVETLLRRHWVRAGFTNDDQERAWFAQALEVLMRLLFEMGAPAGQVLAVESPLWAHIGQDGLRFTLTGRVDRIELLPDDTLELLDYKARPGGMVMAPEALAADLGMFVYYLLARLRYPQHPRVRLSQLNLFSLQQTSVEYTDDQRAENKARLLAAVADIHAGRFDVRPGPHCDWCAVRARCPAYRPDTRWDEL